jgi:poly-gamma-glutamate synthesis protein (capsule biosynthesis protein)
MGLVSSAGSLRAPVANLTAPRAPSSRAWLFAASLLVAPLAGAVVAHLTAPPRPAASIAAPVAVRPPAASPLSPVAAPAAAPAGPRPGASVTLHAAGDYLLHARVQESAGFHGGYAYLTERLAPVLAKGDVNLVNLETPLATLRNPIAAAPAILNGPPEAAVALKSAGFHAAILANNHAYDQTARGVTETRAAVEAASLVAVGGGPSADEARAARTIVTREGVGVALLAFTEMVNAGDFARRLRPESPQVALWRGEADLALVREAAATHDVVVVAMHWGWELSREPTPFQQRTGRALCDAGAHLVAGSHPHVLQPIVQHGDCVLAYSLGNLVSNQGLKYKRGGLEPVEPGSAEARGETRDGALLRVVLTRGDDGRMRVTARAAIPLFTHNNWLERFGVADFRNDIFVAPLAALRADPARAVHHPLYAERSAAVARALGAGVALADE